MIGFRAIQGVALLFGVLAAANTAVADQASCDWYAKTALKQQQENEQRKCGFTGSNWTTDFNAHMVWCTAHPDQFRAEAQRREQQLATCKK